MKRRIFTKNGLPMVITIVVASILGLGLLIAIFIPVTYMGVGPLLAQDVSDKTWITMTDIRIGQWAYGDPVNGSDPSCAEYFPLSMIVTQNLNFGMCVVCVGDV